MAVSFSRVNEPDPSEHNNTINCGLLTMLYITTGRITEVYMWNFWT